MRTGLLTIVLLLVGVLRVTQAEDAAPRPRQITFGPRHHFFGYIGHVGTIPWNASGRYILALETAFQDRMPLARDAATIVLLDAEHDDAPRAIGRTTAWNFQQGTMFYWHPAAAETRFFFNDRDPRTNRVFAVLANTSGERIREYRFDDVPVGNSGVSPDGRQFAAINYGRLARLRPVTGYPEALDTTAGEAHPENDGVFVVDIERGERRLIVSFRHLAKLLAEEYPRLAETPLFINHTLWSPGGSRLFFFCRGAFEDRERRIDVPFVVHADGSGLARLKQHFGGHPEWLDDTRMIGREGKRQVIYDVERQAFVGQIGAAGTFINPEGDIALSPDRRWLVNGAGRGAENFFTFFRLADGRTLRSAPTRRDDWRSGELRIDPAPCWNRRGSAILTTGIADDAERSRQLFLIELPTQGE